MDAMPEAAAGLAPAQQAARASQLQMVCDEVWRSPLAVVAADALVAWLLLGAGFGRWAIAWLVVSCMVSIGRAIGARSLLRRYGSDVKGASRYLLAWFFAVGLTRSWPIVMAFQVERGELHYLVTMVMMGLAAGGVGTVVGFVSMYLAWAAPVAMTLAGAWFSQGTVEGIWIASLLLLMFMLLTVYVRDFGRILGKEIKLGEELREQRDLSDIERRRAEDQRERANAERARAEEERERAEVERARAKIEQATARKERERAELERRRAEEAVVARTRFFETASHDLRQPLSVLRWYGDTVASYAQRLSHEQLSSVASGIERALDRIEPLVGKYLDIARLDAATIPVTRRPCDIYALLQTVLESFAHEAQLRGLLLTIRVADGPRPLVVTTDESLLRGILDNLTGNAIKFTHQGGVELSASTVPGDASMVRLAVTDTGIGIPVAERQLIFDDFYQVANPGRTGNKGVGLGLAIARRQARLLDTELHVSSRAGEGTTFFLEVPAASGTAVQPMAPRPPNRLLERPLKVLVVDDEAEVQLSLRMMLEAAGADVATACGLPDAMAILQSGFGPTALIADYRLNGDVDGLQLIASIAAAGYSMHSLIVTGDTSPERLTQLATSGYPVLHKPVSGDRLLAALLAADVPER